MNGRIYDPLLGRFLSADLLVENPGNLQCFNRYSYVRNNPLTLTDPSGFATDDDSNNFLSWLVSIYTPDTAALPGRGTSETPSRDGDQNAYREGARAGFEKGMEFVAAEAKIFDTAGSLVPGVQVGKDFGQAITGKNLSGQDASRAEGVKGIVVAASLGVAVEVGAKPLSDAAGKIVGAVAKAIGKEGETAARIEGAAVKTGLKDEVKAAPATRGGESAAAADGRRAHENYGAALGEGYDTKVTLPSGKKPDAVNFAKKEVRELKPDNPRAVKRGEKQATEYRKELEEVTGDDFTSVVDTYQRKKKH